MHINQKCQRKSSAYDRALDWRVFLAKRKSPSLISQADKRTLKLVGNRIREIREKKKLSVYDVTGEDMAIKTRQHWQAIENGYKNVNLTTAFKVARTLEIGVDELLRGIG